MQKVLVLLVAMLLVATGAMASNILNSKHNMQSWNTGGTNDEICVYCHTPHKADTAVINAPLWNRANVDPVNHYNSATLNQTYSRPGVVSGAINNSDAPLCLSCHDGASIGVALVNPPNSGTPLTYVGYTMDGNANIGVNMTDDHPIGMNYVAVQTATGAGSDAGGFVAAASGVVNGLNLYNNQVWCSSCHDVHDDQFYPFLATSNTGSGLCLDCHIK